jgi:hypothetical protein
MDLQPSSPSKKPAQPLAELSPNTTSPTKQHDKMSTDARFRPESLFKDKDDNAQQRVDGQGEKQTYISPSDNIMSPTTKKLSAIKGRRFASAKPQSLFAKTLGKQALRSEEQLAGPGADAGKVEK